MSNKPLDHAQAALGPVVDMVWSWEVAEHGPLCSRMARVPASRRGRSKRLSHNHSVYTTGPGAGWESSRALVDTVDGL